MILDVQTYVVYNRNVAKIYICSLQTAAIKTSNICDLQWKHDAAPATQHAAPLKSHFVPHRDAQTHVIYNTNSTLADFGDLWVCHVVLIRLAPGSIIAD